ncbi:hypothetical protein [Bosea beijingensis]
MTETSDTARRDQKSKSLSEIEGRLLRATHDLAGTLGVEPHQAIRALATVVQRRADFERMRRVANVGEPLASR